MAVEGSLDLFRLPEILQVISQEGKTGILTVQGEGDIIAISFSRGKVVAADALNQTLEEGLGDTLAREGLLPQERYAAARQEQKKSGGRLIDVLVSGGYLPREDLLQGLRRHAGQLLETVLDWEDGEFKFYTNDEVSYEQGFEPISIDSFLLQRLTEREPEPEPEPPAPHPVAAPVGEPFPDMAPAAARAAAPAATTAAPRPRPEPAPAAVPRRERVEEADEAERKEPRLDPLARLLGAAAAAAVLAALFLAPARVLAPFPWTGEVAAGLERAILAGRVDAIERAARTRYLLEGQLPEDLQPLVAQGWLAPSTVRTPAGEPLAYRAEGGGFTVAPPAADGSPDDAPEARFDRSIAGDFLLDPALAQAAETPDGPPLVLLD